jgi:hypothetical protein
MSAFFDSSMPSMDGLPIQSGARLLEAHRPLEERALLRQQLRTVQEMLEDLETRPAVGCRHTMKKVIGVLRTQVARGSFRTGPRDELMLSLLVGELEHEAARPLPEVGHFRDQAEPLIALLMATT